MLGHIQFNKQSCIVLFCLVLSQANKDNKEEIQLKQNYELSVFAFSVNIVPTCSAASFSMCTKLIPIYLRKQNSQVLFVASYHSNAVGRRFMYMCVMYMLVNCILKEIYEISWTTVWYDDATIRLFMNFVNARKEKLCLHGGGQVYLKVGVYESNRTRSRMNN